MISKGLHRISSLVAICFTYLDPFRNFQKPEHDFSILNQSPISLPRGNLNLHNCYIPELDMKSFEDMTEEERMEYLRRPPGFTMKPPTPEQLAEQERRRAEWGEEVDVFEGVPAHIPKSGALSPTVPTPAPVTPVMTVPVPPVMTAPVVTPLSGVPPALRKAQPGLVSRRTTKRRFDSRLITESEWHDIPTCPGYAISKEGRVLSKGRYTQMKDDESPRWLEPTLMKRFYNGGYWKFRLRIDGKSTNKGLHNLMADTFLGPCPEGYRLSIRKGWIDGPKLEYLSYVKKGRK